MQCGLLPPPGMRLQLRKQCLCLSFLLLLLLHKVVPDQSCPTPCPGGCPAQPPACAPGVPAVLDRCSCCLVCARQRGESCSELLPCQESSGLYCDRSADPRAEVGICMVLEEDNCVFDGIIYRSGETFQPSCKYQCTCRDGQIGCVPRCNHDLLLPRPDCPFPRKVEVPGECCEQWVCDPKEEVTLGGLALAVYGVALKRSGDKEEICKMNEDTKGKRCLRTKKSLKAIHLQYKNCTSAQTYKPRYCGICTDGRCCTPHNTKTIQVAFQCPQGQIVKKPMMLINTCACHTNCPQSNDAFHQALESKPRRMKI
ncbi:CCN family member 3 [Gracilinanus agilis]|uniref:CCN family member 3 n=1 Tax=Gracilinanus agilis TaxID=191870 RepID=UPI001CFC83A4|nr:CCN family member 3 [Gracilinanus agilis]